jgi:hypothetical protein
MPVESIWARVGHLARIRLPLVAALALVSTITTAWLTAPARRSPGYAPEQPLAFSHRQHAGDMHIACQYCHTGVEESRFAGVPAMGICMKCHVVAAADSADVVTLSAAYARGEVIPWLRVQRLPDYVYFAHDAHVSAGVWCENCHGGVERMEVVRQVHPLSMGSCLACHRNVQSHVRGVDLALTGPEACSACHR